MIGLTATQMKWKVHIDAAKAAGQTLTDYARANELSVQTLYTYSRRINKAGKTPAKSTFVRLQPSASAPGAVRIELTNGVRVHVSGPFDLATLLAEVARLP